MSDDVPCADSTLWDRPVRDLVRRIGRRSLTPADALRAAKSIAGYDRRLDLLAAADLRGELVCGTDGLWRRATTEQREHRLALWESSQRDLAVALQNRLTPSEDG
jgi:hypothetical protein